MTRWTCHVEHTWHSRNSRIILPTIEYPRSDRSSSETQGSVCPSDQRLTTRRRSVTRCYASLIAITRFHIAIKRMYVRLIPDNQQSTLGGSIVAWHLSCEPCTSMQEGEGRLWSPWLRIPIAGSSFAFHLAATIKRRHPRDKRKTRGNDSAASIFFGFPWRSGESWLRNRDSHGYRVRWNPPSHRTMLRRSSACVMLDLLNRAWSAARNARRKRSLTRAFSRPARKKDNCAVRWMRPRYSVA